MNRTELGVDAREEAQVQPRQSLVDRLRGAPQMGSDLLHGLLRDVAALDQVELPLLQLADAGAQRLGALRGFPAGLGEGVGQRLDRFVAEAPGFADFFAPGASPNKRMFDLPGFVLDRLGAAGVGACHWVGYDTCAEPDLFFSNRWAFKQGEPDFGRLLSAIVLT